MSRRVKSIVEPELPEKEEPEEEKPEEKKKSARVAQKIRTLNSQALNSALLVGNFITLKNEIEKLEYCDAYCPDQFHQECYDALEGKARLKTYCLRYPIHFKIALSSISILLQAIYGMMDISLMVEKRQDENAGLDEDEMEEKMQNRTTYTYCIGTIGLFISVVNYLLTAFE